MKTSTKVVLTLLLLGLAAVLGWRAARSPEKTTRNRAVAHRELATQVLGEYLATLLAGKQALILSNPFTERPGQPNEVYAFEAAGIRGLKQGWGERIRLLGVAFPELSAAAKENPGTVPVDPDTKTPLSFLTAENAWDTLAQKHPGAELFVSLIGLPLHPGDLSVWRRPKPQFALLLPDLRMIGSPAALQAAFRSGKLVAMVLNKPGAPPETAPAQSDHRAEFERRFLLVTAQNVEEMLKVYPQAF